MESESLAKIYIIEIKRVSSILGAAATEKGGAFFAWSLRDVVENTW
jgi:hypothetical protein